MMDSDLLIPLFWMLVFGILITIGVRRLTRKLPVEKEWVRPEAEQEINKEE